MGVKYIWWDYAKKLVRIYPERKKEYEDMILPRSPVIDGMPRSGQSGDAIGAKLASIERTAAYKDYSAVHSALAICQGINDHFMDFVNLYYWTPRRKYSLEDVAEELFYSPETIRKWNKRLLYAVAHNRGLMD